MKKGELIAGIAFLCIFFFLMLPYVIFLSSYTLNIRSRKDTFRGAFLDQEQVADNVQINKNSNLGDNFPYIIVEDHYLCLEGHKREKSAAFFEEARDIRNELAEHSLWWNNMHGACLSLFWIITVIEILLIFYVTYKFLKEARKEEGKDDFKFVLWKKSGVKLFVFLFYLILISVSLTHIHMPTLTAFFHLPFLLIQPDTPCLTSEHEEGMRYIFICKNWGLIVFITGIVHFIALSSPKCVNDPNTCLGMKTFCVTIDLAFLVENFYRYAYLWRIYGDIDTVEIKEIFIMIHIGVGGYIFFLFVVSGFMWFLTKYYKQRRRAEEEEETRKRALGGRSPEVGKGEVVVNMGQEVKKGEVNPQDTPEILESNRV